MWDPVSQQEPKGKPRVVRDKGADHDSRAGCCVSGGPDLSSESNPANARISLELRRESGRERAPVVMIDRQLFEHPSAGSLAPIVESAATFGLTPDEIWEILVSTPDQLSEDVRSHYLDELSGALAKRLLEKERRD
jgi:hypothetical protein